MLGSLRVLDKETLNLLNFLIKYNILSEHNVTNPDFAILISGVPLDLQIHEHVVGFQD